MVKWAGHYEDKILRLLPVDGSKVKAKEIYEKAHDEKGHFSSATVNKYLNSLMKKGFVERIQESQKNVFYKRCEDVRIKSLTDDFLKEILRTISQLSEEVHLSHGGTYGIYLDNIEIILAILIRKVHEIYINQFPEDFRGGHSDFYIGVFDHVYIVPKALIEEKIKPSEISAWFRNALKKWFLTHHPEGTV